MRDLPRPEYPRPQFRRPEWTNLNGEWAFAFDDEDAGLAHGWHNVSVDHLYSDASPFDRHITVPFCYQSRLSGIGDPSFHDVVWYARTFDPPRAGERLLLHFGAVDYRATVWVDGTQVAFHEGGHTPFSADVTPALAGGENVRRRAGRGPFEGRDDPQGQAVLEGEIGGDLLHQDHRDLADRLARAGGTPALRLLAPYARRGRGPRGCRGRRRRLPSRPLAAPRGLASEKNPCWTIGRSCRRPLIQRSLPLLRRGAAPDTPHLSEWPLAALWSPEHPNLYDLRLELLDADGNAPGRRGGYFGMRKIEARGGQVLLNDRPYYQRLVLDQGYFPGGLLTAPTDERPAQRHRAREGDGLQRGPQTPEDRRPRWLFWAGTLGFLVWGEMANAYQYSPHLRPAHHDRVAGSSPPRYIHPCIVAWVPMNESWGVPDLATNPAQIDHLLSLYHLTCSLDHSRLVVSNDGWEHARTDLCTIHDYGVETLSRR